MNEYAAIIAGFVQLVFTGGIFMWLIKKITGFGERLSGIESVFEYMRLDHDRSIKNEVRQDKTERDVNEYYQRLRALEGRQNERSSNR